MQLMQASVTFESAGSGASLPRFESAFSSLGHRLIETEQSVPLRAGCPRAGSRWACRPGDGHQVAPGALSVHLS